MENNQQENSKIKLDFKEGKYATGRRKTSIAKVWLKKGTGKIIVNGKKFEDYFTRETHKMQILRPFEIVNQSTDYDVRCNVVGGGHTGQAGAMVHGISRALLKFDENCTIVKPRVSGIKFWRNSGLRGSLDRDFAPSLLTIHHHSTSKSA